MKVLSKLLVLGLIVSTLLGFFIVFLQNNIIANADDIVKKSTSEGIQSATWQCPETQLATTDSIVIRVYTAMYDQYEGFYPWFLQGTWTTPQLGTTKLKASIWTAYYYTYWLRLKYTGYVSITSRFYYDTATYNSRIIGITY